MKTTQAREEGIVKETRYDNKGKRIKGCFLFPKRRGYYDDLFNITLKEWFGDEFCYTASDFTNVGKKDKAKQLCP